MNIELTPTYEEATRTLLREAGLEDRVERRVMDFAEATGEVEAADIVIMNRVICRYPDMPKLAGAGLPLNTSQHPVVVAYRLGPE